MLSRHFAMNFSRSRALSPAGSAARRSAALRRKTFVGTWRCCWRFLMRNCLNASCSDGASLSSASSWPLAVISARGAMGCGLLGSTSESDEVRRRREDSRTVVGCRARRRGCRATGAAYDTGTDCRREIPNDTPLAEPRSQRSMGPPGGRSGSVDASSATRTKLAAVRH